MEFVKEIWKPIRIEKNGVFFDFSDLYEINNFGRVRNKLTKQVLKLRKHRNGYFMAVLCRNGIKEAFRIHRLVATMFIPNPYNLPEVNHIDGVKTNNFVKNLEWCTNLENVRHAHRINLIDYDVWKRNSKKGGDAVSVKVNQFDFDGNLIGTYNSLTEAAKAVGLLTGNSIKKCCRGKMKSAGGYVWEYFDKSNLHSTRKVKVKVNQYDLYGNFLNTFDSMISAAKAVGLKSSNGIKKCCENLASSAGGYIWKYS